MAYDSVYETIKDFLSTPANIASVKDPETNEVPPIRFENETFEPDPEKPWIKMALTGVLYGQESIGASRQSDNRWDETGHLWLTVLMPSGYGAERPRKIAKRMADVFRGLTLIGGNLEFMDAFIGEGQPSEEAGNWWELPLVLEWRHVEA